MRCAFQLLIVLAVALPARADRLAEVMRIHTDGTLTVVTTYDDFRPVEDVILPYRATTTIDGRTTQVTTLYRIEANPSFEAGTFNPPVEVASTQSRL